jgi:ergothioneine biosynthesis protein EgtB
MRTTSAAPGIDRAALVERFRRTRARSRALFDLLEPEAYYSRPIALRHPIVFYEGHLAAFSLNTVVKRALGRPGVDERLERLFARGIDPDDLAAADRSGPAAWPVRTEVRAFVEAADALVLAALRGAELERPGDPLLDRAQAVFAILEHEAMHQETMLYMWHQLPLDQKRRPGDLPLTIGGAPPAAEVVDIPAGRATLGARPGEIAFGWDNEFPALEVDVPAFAIDRHDVTNEAYLEFVEAGGYGDQRWWTPDAFAWVRAENRSHPLFWTKRGGVWLWRGMFGEIPLPAAWPVYVSQSEAAAFAKWRGARLPSEAEFHRAAYGTPSGEEREQPWGAGDPDPSRGNVDFNHWEPVPAGSHPGGRSAWGIDDLVGNGWEWTHTVFAPFPGFAPLPSYPEYSADFFDGQHYVIKGASPATDRDLIRRSFRNWFRPQYPYVYATFRCVR